MKKIFLFIFTTFSILFAQKSLSYKVDVKLPYLVGSSVFTVTQTVTQGSINDGSSFTVPKITLPSSPINLTQFQGLADALENSIVGIEQGALADDISIVITIEGMDPDGKYSNVFGANVFWFATADVYVNGNKVTGDYYFNSGKKFYWKFKKTNLFPFVQQCLPNWTPAQLDSLVFAYLLQTSPEPLWTTSEITTVDEGDYFSFYALHLSKLAGGRGKTFKTTSNEKLNINSFYVNQNYPNPFNPVTNISFNLPKPADVKIEIYNAIGNIIRKDILKNVNSGVYNYKFDAQNLPTGIYYAKITALNQNKIIKMLYLK